MNSTAKKIVLTAFLLLMAAMLWQSLAGDGMHVNIDGDEVDGPLGWLLGLLLAGGGMLIAAVAMVCAALFVALLFAGLGLVMISALVLVAVTLLACVSPLLLPLLIPIGLIWMFGARARKQRQRALADHAV